MSEPLPPWLANVDPRFVQPDWKKFVRPDWQRWILPGTCFDAQPAPRSEFERLYRPYREEQPPQRSAAGLTEADILFFRSNLAALRFKLAMLKWRIKAGFNPNQPRVPAGNPDGGQWTDDGGTSARLAAADKPRLGAATIAAVAARVAKRIIDAYRAENGLFDLFGHKDGRLHMRRLMEKIFSVPTRLHPHTPPAMTRQRELCGTR